MFGTSPLTPVQPDGFCQLLVLRYLVRLPLVGLGFIMAWGDLDIPHLKHYSSGQKVLAC
jgi:hypothetical protein